MSFISKKERMFKKRTKCNKFVKGNLKNCDNCLDRRLWSLNLYDRHQALLDETLGVQYEGEDEENPQETQNNGLRPGNDNVERLKKEHDVQIEQYRKLNQKLTTDNEKMIALLKKVEKEKAQLSEMNKELNQFRKQLQDKRKSVDLEQEYRGKLQQQANDYETKIRNLQSELKSNVNILHVFEAQMRDLPAMERELEEIKKTYNKEQLEMAKLRKDLNTMEADNSQLKSLEKDLIHLKHEKLEIQRKSEEFEKNTKKILNQNAEEIKILKQNLEAAKNSLIKEKSALIDKHSQEMEKLKKNSIEDGKKSEIKLKQFETDFDQLQKNNEVLRKDSEKLNELRKASLTEIEKYKMRIYEFEQKIKADDVNSTKLKEEINKLIHLKDLLEKQQKETLDKLKRDHANELKIIKANEESQKALSAEIGKLKAQLNEMRKEKDEAKKLMEQQTSLTIVREKEISELKSNIQRLSSDNDSLSKLNVEHQKMMKTQLEKKPEAITATKSDTHMNPACQNRPCVEKCMCKILTPTDKKNQPTNVKDVLAKALVDGLQSLSFNEIAQLHQNIQNTLAENLENGKIDVKLDPPVTLSHVHKATEPLKKSLIKNLNDVEKKLKSNQKNQKIDVANLERGVYATKRRVARLKEKIQATEIKTRR